MKVFILVAILLSFQTTDAQFGKRLKDKARETAERKANQKADEVINKSADKIDSVITGKKRDKTNKTKTESETTEPASDNTNSSSNNTGNGTVEAIYKEVIIKTNIRCETGKKKLEAILRDTDGVSSILIDTDNGNLYLSSENSDVRNKVIELIRQSSFEADGKKPTTPNPNPCK